MRKFYFLVLGLLFISGVQAQIVNIPDANFKAKLLASSSTVSIAYNFQGKRFKIDANNDREIQLTEALNVGELYINDSNISSLEGLSSFTNLTNLNFSKNNITLFDITPLVKLTYLNCSETQLNSLDVKPLINLTTLDCSQNSLKSIDVKSLVNLTSLNCSKNQLTSLDINNLVNLGILVCSFNQLTSLDISSLINLRAIYCDNNQLTSLDTTPFAYLYDLRCAFNYIGILNIKNNPILNFAVSDFLYDKNLIYICANDEQMSELQFLINQSGLINLNVNTYCSFVPGIDYYTINGSCKLDTSEDGCDDADTNYPNLKIAIFDGINNQNLISDLSGNYYLNVRAGTYTITPVIENPYYFKISPDNIVVTFPTETSSVLHNFCLIPINHPDLEVTVLSIIRSRPGFDASYKIIYKNKGTNTQSGALNLTFNDAVLDLVSANPTVTTQSAANLSWNFTDLKPFETREIEVNFNVNSPMETPAVNIDDILSYTATITSAQIDETPTDNTFTLNQIVVGSLDPNDKTCLEGTTIQPSAVGKYVHYLIRFENKGTAEAQNVVVKDMIDTDKFDVNSLVVTQGSHPFVTRITETNKVEFIFENINLPFDDATNDGYVAFKIKTLPSLVVGDSFSNTASIYFDYNFPIVTNTATTSVLQSLGNQDFEFDSYFSVYPNPAKNTLNLDIKKQIKLSSISIYNTLGQQILVIPNAQQTKQVDVSSLKTGNYFIKLTSDKGSTIGKFIKN